MPEAGQGNEARGGYSSTRLSLAAHSFAAGTSNAVMKKQMHGHSNVVGFFPLYANWSSPVSWVAIIPLVGCEQWTGSGEEMHTVKSDSILWGSLSPCVYMHIRTRVEAY